MLDKIIIGTANFTQSYGILNQHHDITNNEVNAVFKCAIDNGIHTFDTAFAYGDLFNTLNKSSQYNAINVITKFSVLDNYETVLQKMKKLKTIHLNDSCYAVLIHDPQNLDKIDINQLETFLKYLRNNNYVKKIGVSVYSTGEIKQFHKIMTPDIVQIPLNPLNQKFINDEFLEYIDKYNVEVHARSLFLQGILLADKLPELLIKLKPLWDDFISIVNQYPSKLKVLFSWALAHKWVNKWIIGVASLDNLQEIINCVKSIGYENNVDLFKSFHNINDPLIDPRNWSLA